MIVVLGSLARGGLRKREALRIKTNAGTKDEQFAFGAFAYLAADMGVFLSHGASLARAAGGLNRSLCSELPGSIKVASCFDLASLCLECRANSSVQVSFQLPQILLQRHPEGRSPHICETAKSTPGRNGQTSCDVDSRLP